MTSTNDGTEIAIIGKACRFPGANDQRQYWQNLREGKESVTFFDSEALRAAGVADELIDDPAYVKAFGALDDIDLFDAGFFGFSARDATVLDPQQRVLLETAWQALEDAGQRRFGDDVTVGVFAGSSMSTYLLANLLPGRAMDTSPDGFELLIANDKDYLASRIAYKLDLDGPAVSVQTACSTSMVAVHLACQSLLSYDCDVALAGGATIRLPQHGYRYQEGMILSADGHCRPFDAKASGTIGGNGAGIVVLKRLDDALADGDRIDAVIKGSAVNNDGARKVGYTAPGSTGQAKVVAAALGAAGIDPGTIGAIEAHGTGTALGDPIEIAALTKVFGPYHAGGCPIGSVKSNIGHLDSAAGIAALIKAILQLQHREIAPSLNFEQENPDIGFDATPFFVNTELRPWQATGTPRRIGVSSFGFGGTNAHCVLEEAPAATRSTPGKPVQAIVLSARSAGALDAMTGRIGRELRESGEPLADTAFSLQTTRTALPHRRVVLCSSAEDAAEAIENRDPQRVLSRQAGDAPEVAWLFPGQGTQYPAMGRDLYRDEPVFRAGVDECAELLRPHLGLDLRDVLYAEDGGDRIERTELAQPALFTVEYALAKTLESWCGKPKAMLGHSVGEVVAACLAGVFTLPDALHMVAVRGKLMQQQPSGAMLTVALSEDDLREVLVPSVEIAAINAPGQCAVAGTHDAIDEFAELLRERGIDFGRLHTSHAFHTAMMDPAVAPLTEALSRIPLSAPAIPFLSNRSGDWITAAQATDPAYWAGQVRDPVRFHACLRKLAADPGTVLLEAGPGHTLGSLSRMDPDLRGHVLVNAMRAPAEEHSDTRFLLDAVGRLWLTGVEVDWAAMHEGEHRRLLSLPPYAFDRKRYWIGAPAGGETPTRSLDSAIVSTVEEETEDEQSGGSRPDLLTAYAAPETEAQQRIARIWQDLIGVGPIGIHDNFIELGGHSLLATKIVAGVRAEFAVDVPLRDLIAAPTVEAMAALVVEAGGAPSERERLPVAVPDPAARYEPFPLSEIQQAQWIGRSANFSVGNVAAHIYWEVEDDRIDLGRLGGSFNRILARHDMLRAIITSDGTQRILADAGPYEIDVLDLRTTPADRAAEELALVRERMSHEVRPGDEWPLFNIRAALLPGGLTRVFLGFDLMVSDMGSVRVMLRDWRTLYEDPSAELTPLRITFRDYLMAIGKLKESALYQRSLAYWRDRVRDLPPAPELPLATAPDTITEPRFVPCSRTLPVAQWESIKERAGKYGVTPSAVLLAAYALVLGTWSTSEKFTLNVTTNNRLPVHEDVGGLVGGFASFNLVPVDLAEHGTLGAIARAIQAQSWEDLDHRYVNGVDVLRELARARGGTSGSVMPIVYTSTLVDESETERSMVDWIGGLTYEVIQTPQVWLDAGVLEVSDGLYLSWPAVEGLFAAGVVEEMFAAYCGVLELLAGGDSGWESGVDSVLPGWQREVIESVNDTAAPIDVQLLHGPLVECALADPSARAVFADGEWTTFGELYVRACRTARTLRSLGVGPGQVVAVSMDKTAAQITAVVAVLLAGGVYVPIDPELPTARRHHMATHAGARLILTTEARETLDWPDNTRVALLDTAPVDLAEATRDATPEQVSQLDDLAYIIYTSGSTGLPKGVAITHRAASNTCLDINARFGVTAADRALALSSLSFDLSVWDVFGVLGAGGSLVLPATGRDPAHWHELITTHDITVWNSVPALMTMYTEHLPTGTPATSLRLVMLSGDWIPLALPDNLWATHPDIDLYSLGGATEAAIWSVYHPITALDPEWTSIPYGTPLANQQLHVLDTQLQPCPIHTTGDLYISGDGLATGYHNDPGKTHAAFLTHPTTGTRLYKTGDLARRHPDGTLEFLGRTDTQVKINGHRIELGEIETTLTTHPDIHTAIATTTGPPHHKQLHAYLYPHPHTTLTPEQLRTQTHHHLTQTLPTYMHPTTTTILTHLPLTPNGKINRNHLPHPTTTTPETTTADAPLSELAVRLAAIAAEVLGVEHIDARASFFEVGGDSITAVQIAARAGDQGVQLVLADLFEAETIADAAAIIEARATSLDGAGDAVELTPSQRALLDGAKPGGTANWVELPVDADFFVCPEWIEALLRRHPALRGRFERDGEDWVQRIGEAGTYVPEIDLRVLREDRQRGAMRQMVDEMREELDPREGGLVKFAVFDLHDTRYLVCLAHELVADGRSWGALLGELAGLTGATEAAPARVTLGAEETATILTAAEETYRMSAEEVVLAACLDLLGGTGSTVHFEHDRREQPTAVGALGGIAEIGPVEPGTELPEVKRRYRSAVEAPAVHSPDVLVRSLGSVPCPVPAWPHWEPAGRAAAELTWAIADGGLVVAWTGDAPATSTDFADAVRRVGQRCRGHEEIHVDTGDFPLADVDDEDLAAVFAEVSGEFH